MRKLDEEWENIVSYMDDDIREDIHGDVRDGQFDTHLSFLVEYLRRDPSPDFAEILEFQLDFPYDYDFFIKDVNDGKLDAWLLDKYKNTEFDGEDYTPGDYCFPFAFDYMENYLGIVPGYDNSELVTLGDKTFERFAEKYETDQYYERDIEKIMPLAIRANIKAYFDKSCSWTEDEIDEEFMWLLKENHIKTVERTDFHLGILDGARYYLINRFINEYETDQYSAEEKEEITDAAYDRARIMENQFPYSDNPSSDDHFNEFLSELESYYEVPLTRKEHEAEPAEDDEAEL